MTQRARDLKAILAERGIKATIIEAQAEQQCDLCGKIAELRPYGPNGEAICHECGKRNPAATMERMNAALFGASVVPPPSPSETPR